jgi:plastocyanin
MLTLLDYTDHTSYLEEQAAAPAEDATATPQPTAEPTTAATSGGTAEVEVVASEFAFDPDQVTFDPGAEVTISLRNDGAILHNLEIQELGVFVEAEAGETAEVRFTAPDGGGPFTFICNIPGHREGGMEGAIFVRRE